MGRLSATQWDDAMPCLSSATGFGVKVSNMDMRQAVPDASVKVTYDDRREKDACWESNRSLPLFPVLEMAVVDADQAPEYDIEPGAARTVEAQSRIALPPGYGVSGRVPRNG